MPTRDAMYGCASSNMPDSRLRPLIAPISSSVDSSPAIELAAASPAPEYSRSVSAMMASMAACAESAPLEMSLMSAWPVLPVASSRMRITSTPASVSWLTSSMLNRPLVRICPSARLMRSIDSPPAPVAVLKFSIACVNRCASCVLKPRAIESRNACATSSCLNGLAMASCCIQSSNSFDLPDVCAIASCIDDA